MVSFTSIHPTKQEGHRMPKTKMVWHWTVPKSEHKIHSCLLKRLLHYAPCVCNFSIIRQLATVKSAAKKKVIEFVCSFLHRSSMVKVTKSQVRCPRFEPHGILTNSHFYHFPGRLSKQQIKSQLKLRQHKKRIRLMEQFFLCLLIILKHVHIN